MLATALGWFKGLSILGRTAVIATTIAATSVGGAAVNNSNGTQNLNATNASSQQEQKVSITHETVTVTKDLPFKSTKVEDSSLNKGSTKVTTVGVKGQITEKYDVTYKNGVESSRELISSETTTKPIDEVVAVGTYEAPAQPSCPNGTYVNTYGNEVCRPYESDGAPAGATAQCVDGTYSFSQTRRGTCSHHGGVARWL
jgi:hypothetical protein